MVISKTFQQYSENNVYLMQMKLNHYQNNKKWNSRQGFKEKPPACECDKTPTSKLSGEPLCLRLADHTSQLSEPIPNDTNILSQQ